MGDWRLPQVPIVIEFQRRGEKQGKTRMMERTVGVWMNVQPHLSGPKLGLLEES